MQKRWHLTQNLWFKFWLNHFSYPVYSLNSKHFFLKNFSRLCPRYILISSWLLLKKLYFQKKNQAKALSIWIRIWILLNVHFKYFRFWTECLKVGESALSEQILSKTSSQRLQDNFFKLDIYQMKLECWLYKLIFLTKTPCFTSKNLMRTKFSKLVSLIA